MSFSDDSPPAETTVEDETTSPLIPDPTLPGRARQHYPALDGLRGVAILMVLLFHGFLGMNWSSPLGGRLAAIPLMGWVGVDVFFVLSGFLITGILLDSRDASRYFLNFYARRFQRIFPIYYLLLIFVFLILPRLIPFDSDGLKTIQHNQGWIWTYLTNIGFVVNRKAWATSDWLDLNHLWSLAVEEQFYLVWPLVVFYLSRRSLKVTCILCIVGSLACRTILWLTHQRNGAIYFPTPCRLDGLALGALAAALLRENRGVAAVLGGKKTLAGVAMLAIVAIGLWRGGFQFTDSPTVVFGVTVVIFLTVTVLETSLEPASRVARILSNPALRSAGKYSYAIYLFHAPIRAPLAYLLPDSTLIALFHSELIGRSVFVAIFAIVSFALAIASWHLFEKHWIKLKRHFDYKPLQTTDLLTPEVSSSPPLN